MKPSRSAFRFDMFATLSVLFLLAIPQIFAQPAKIVDGDLKLQFEKFKTAGVKACGERAEAVTIGERIVKLYGGDEINRQVIVFVKKKTASIAAEDRECRERYSLPQLLKEFRAASEPDCPSVYSLRVLYDEIIKRYGDDENNAAEVGLVRESFSKAEWRGYLCTLRAEFTNAVKRKDWSAAFVEGKRLLVAENDPPVRFGVMIDMATVGHRLTAYDKSDVRNSETLSYAKDALEMIADGKQAGNCWGYAICYNSREKAEGWLNYIAGFVSYFKLREQTKGVEFFYRATQTDSEFSEDAFVYHAAVIHYFSKQPGMVSYSTVNDLLTTAVIAPNLLADSTLSADDAAHYRQISKMYTKLQELYELRYGMLPNENILNFQDYLTKLVDRPLIDSSADVKSRPKIKRYRN